MLADQVRRAGQGCAQGDRNRRIGRGVAQCHGEVSAPAFETDAADGRAGQALFEFLRGPGGQFQQGGAVKAVDEATRQKWLKVKAALEAAGKTDCHYYRLAVAALANV